MSILNVEDYAPMRYLRTRALEQAGFRVREAETVAEARRCLAETMPRLVLTDLRLPDGSGFDLCESIKATNPTLPVVMITSTYRTADARRDAFRMGADAFLLDPVPSETLLRTIRQFTTPPTARKESLPAVVVTDTAGTMVTLTEQASRLFNLSARGARGRKILPFFPEVRVQILQDMKRAAEGLIVQRQVTIRPRERKAFTAWLDLSIDDAQLHWRIEPTA